MERIIRFIISYAYAAISCLYLFTIGFFIAKNRCLIYEICNHFGYPKKSRQSTPMPELIIPEVELSKVIPKSISVQIPEAAAVDGNISFLETIVVAELIKHFNPSSIFEIGTFDGRTTLNMASNCAGEAKVYTLDLPKDKLNSTKLQILPLEEQYINKEIIGRIYLGTEYEKKIVQLIGDSATFDFSPFYGKIDFILIDGSHSYEYIINDSKLALKLLRNGRGVILWHDYGVGGWEGLAIALNELYSEAIEYRNLKHIQQTSLVCLVIGDAAMSHNVMHGVL
jgi:hypothetical protein